MTFGTIKCNDLTTAELFLVVNFPDDFFGANIRNVEKGEFLMIPVKEVYGDDADPIKIAVRNVDGHIKIKNGLCDVMEDEDGIVRKPFKNVVSENSKIIKRE